jgi:hypothetical protein
MLEALPNPSPVWYAFDRLYPAEWVYSQVLDRPRRLQDCVDLEDRFYRIGGVHFWRGLSNHTEPDGDLTAPMLNVIESLYKDFYDSVAKCTVYRSIDHSPWKVYKNRRTP